MWWQCGGTITTHLTLRNFQWYTFQNCAKSYTPLEKCIKHKSSDRKSPLYFHRSYNSMALYKCWESSVVCDALLSETAHRWQSHDLSFQCGTVPKRSLDLILFVTVQPPGVFLPVYSNSELNWICQREFGTADGGLSVVTVRARWEYLPNTTTLTPITGICVMPLFAI